MMAGGAIVARLFGLLGRVPLARSNAEPWINPNWRSAQR